MDQCKYCGNPLKKRERPDTPHEAEAICITCGRHNHWIKKVTNEGVRTKTSKHSLRQVCDFYEKKTPTCFFCLRTKEQLGLHETLTLDHIDEVSKGGTDRLNNLQVLCTACHKLKNWARLYMNWHFNKEG